MAVAALLFTAASVAQIVPAAPTTPPGPANESPAQQALRARVNQFYTLLQTRQIARAETYCTNESRELLRDQVQGTFLAFRLISIDMNADQAGADVVIELTQMVEFAGMPFPIQRDTKWVMEEGEWRILVPVPPTNTMDITMAMGEKAPPKPEELVFKGHRFGLGVMKPGDRKEARFPFTNATDHAVTIAQIQTGCECLTAKTAKDKVEYQPGESDELVIEFDSTGYEYEFAQSVVVKTNPGGVTSYLHIRATVVPRAIAFPEKKAAPAPQK